MPSAYARALAAFAVAAAIAATGPAAASADYASTVMGTQGLQSYWRLATTTGTPATTPDAKGGKTLTFGSEVQAPLDWAEFESGRAPLIGGTTDPSLFLTDTVGRAANPTDFSFLETLPWTVETWVNVPAVDATPRVIASKYDQYVGGWSLAIVNDGGVNRASVRQDWNQGGYQGDGYWETTHWAATGGNITPGVAHMIAATSDGTTMKLYVDGSLVATTTIASPVGRSSNPLMLGGLQPSRTDPTIERPFTGVIDDFAIYNTALTASTISTHRTLGLRAGVPESTAAPVLSAAGSGYATTNGTWTASPTTYAYRWQRCEPNPAYNSQHCKTIPGATSATYTPIAQTQGKPLRALVYASNANGTSIRASAPVTPTSAAPSATLTSPSAGATVSGQVAIQSSAGTSTVGVQFFVDGKAIGREDTVSPFEERIDTSLLANGSHTLTAVARNGADQTVTSASRTITVSNTIEGAFIRAVQAVSENTGSTYPHPPEPLYSTNLQAKVVRYEAPPDPVDLPITAASPVANAIGQYKAAGIKAIWLVEKPETSDTDARAVIQTVDRIRAAHPGTLVAVELENEESYSYKRSGASRQAYAAAYAQRAKTIGTALRYTVPVWAIGDADNSDASVSEWLDAMQAEVSDLDQYVDAWTIHPYGNPNVGGLMRTKWDRSVVRLAAKGWHTKMAVTEVGIAAYETSPGVGGKIWYGDDLSNTTANTTGWSYSQAAAWYQTIWTYLFTKRPNLVALSVYAGADNWHPNWTGGVVPTLNGGIEGERFFGALTHDSSSPGSGGAKGAMTTAVRNFNNALAP